MDFLDVVGVILVRWEQFVGEIFSTDSKNWPVQNKTKRFMADYVTWDVDATKHFPAASLIVL